MNLQKNTDYGRFESVLSWVAGLRLIWRPSGRGGSVIRPKGVPLPRLH